MVETMIQHLIFLFLYVCRVSSLTSLTSGNTGLIFFLTLSLLEFHVALGLYLWITLGKGFI